MIVVTLMDGKLVEQFENYNELFDCLIAIENLKLVAKNPDFKNMNWSFTIHPPRRVETFNAYLKGRSEAVKEAYEEGLSLIEISAGDYTKPTYIALTPNIDLDYLKKNWCLAYCAHHHLVGREL